MEKIPVFYCPEICADSESFSPSSSKPRPVVEAWLELDLPLDIRAPSPVTVAQLNKVHDPAFVADILSCSRRNGFGSFSPAVAESLRYTSGSMLKAACEAMFNGIGAVSPTSGFHHAGYDFAGGYCTFNGLMVAAINMSVAGLDVGILDCDMHYGNGTDDIIKHLGVGDRITHYSQGASRMRGGAHWLKKKLPDIVDQFASCDIVLYQAGADPHIDDPLGGWLTTKQLFERDRFVFNRLRDWGVPVAWNLAGGYQDPLSKVIEIHTNTMRAFAELF